MTDGAPSVDPGRDAAGHIEIHRDDATRADSLVRYRIVIDGEPRGHIREGEKRQLTVRPGPHRMWLTSYLIYRSPAHDVEVSAGQTVRMRCRPSAGLQATRLFDPANYIRLIQELDEPESPVRAPDASPRERG